MTTTEEPRPEGRAAKALVAAGIVALAFNLRPAAVSVGPVLHEMRSGLGMSSTTAGVLISNRRVNAASPSIMDIAPTVLNYFRIPIPGDIDGKALF